MRIALIGYGKMGKAIEAIAQNRGHEIIFKGTSNNKNEYAGALSKADVAIEFTNPLSAFDNIVACFEQNTPIVVGTTGWLERLKDVKDLCEKQNQALLYASNFSIGVNIFFEINKKLASLMNSQQGYDVRMKEIHHTQKLDAPSGTAISLANDIISNYTSKTHWELDGASDNNALPIVSERTGEVPGTHIIEYFSSIDTLSIKHEAHTREGFALGSVIAAEWIIGKKGIFGMKDVLNIKS